jgi:hypothetical protein
VADGQTLLGLQGVYPVAPNNDGFTLAQITGVWVEAAPNDGFTLEQITGVWVEGLPTVITPGPKPEPSVSGADKQQYAKPEIERPIIQLDQPLEQKSIYSQLYREDEEIITLVMSMIRIGIIR